MFFAISIFFKVLSGGDARIPKFIYFPQEWEFYFVTAAKILNVFF